MSIFLKSGRSNLVWNIVKSLLRGVFLEKARTCLEGMIQVFFKPRFMHVYTNKGYSN